MPAHIERDDERVMLVTSSGYQTVSMLDGGRTGLYWDAPEDLLRGMNHIDRIVLLGLGGGEMLRAAQRVQPDAGLLGIDIDPDVVRAARDEFHAPGDFLIGDAIDWARTHQQGEYDVVMVDLYIDDQMVPLSTGLGFIGTCAHVLRPSGFLIMNVFPAERAAEIEARLNLYFVVAPKSYGPNVVLFAIKRS